MTTKSSSHLTLLFLLTLLLSSCGDKQAVVLIDNPTKKEVKLSFDNGFTTYVSPWKSKTIKFDNMSARMSINDQDVGELFLSPGQEYILNPTYSAYIIEKLSYGDAASMAANMFAKMRDTENGAVDTDPLPPASIKVDTFDYFGHVQTTNALLIDRFWDIGLNEKAPHSVEVGQYNGSSSLIKVFRDYEFIRFHKLK